MAVRSRRFGPEDTRYIRVAPKRPLPEPFPIRCSRFPRGADSRARRAISESGRAWEPRGRYVENNRPSADRGW